MERRFLDGSRSAIIFSERQRRVVGDLSARLLVLAALTLSLAGTAKAAANPNSGENPEGTPTCDTSGSSLQPPPELDCSYFDDQGEILPPDVDIYDPTAINDNLVANGPGPETAQPVNAVVIPTAIPTQVPPTPTPVTQATPNLNFHFNLDLKHAQNLPDSQKQELVTLVQNSYYYYSQVLHDGPSNDVTFHVITDTAPPTNQVSRRDFQPGEPGRVLLWPNFRGWDTTGSYGLPGLAYQQSILIHEEDHQIQFDAYTRGLTTGVPNSASFSLSEGWATREGYEGAATVLHLDPMIPRRCTLLNLKKSDGFNFEYISDINHAGAFIGTESGRAYELSYIGVVELEKAAAPMIEAQGGRIQAMKRYYEDIGLLGSEASLIKHYGIGTPTINQLVFQAVNSFSGTCP